MSILALQTSPTLSSLDEVRGSLREAQPLSHNWPMVRLGEIVEKVHTINPTKIDGLINYIDIASIDNGTKRITEHKTLVATEAPSRARQRVQSGDILVSTVRPNLNAVAIVEEYKNETIASTGFCVLRVNKQLAVARYVFHFAKSQNFVSNLVKLATGASYPAVSDKTVLNQQIPLPPLPVQQKIATILDQATTLIEKRKTQLEKLDTLIKSRFVEMFGDPVTNPNEFPVLTIGAVIEFQGGSQPEKSAFEYCSTNSNIRLIQVRDYRTDEYKTYIPVSLARKKCTNDDIMIGRYGPPIFQIFQGLEGAYNVALMKAVPKMGDRVFIREFLKQRSLLEYLESLSQRTAGQSGVDMDCLKNYPFPYPSEGIQSAFANFVCQVDKSKFEIEQGLNRLKQSRKSLMQIFFEYEIFDSTNKREDYK